jgi:hypothetical protein
MSGSGEQVDWRQFASCAGKDPTLWESGPWSVQQMEKLSIAKGICDRCPVSAECLKSATAADLVDVMRGGVFPTGQNVAGSGKPAIFGPRNMLTKGACPAGHQIGSLADMYPSGECKKCSNERQATRRSQEKTERKPRKLRTHCKQGHALVGENILNPVKNTCRTCHNARKRRARKQGKSPQQAKIPV